VTRSEGSRDGGSRAGTAEQVLAHKAEGATRVQERGNEVKEQVAGRVRDLRDQAAQRKGTGLMSAFDKNKVAYESLSLISGVLSGALAGAVFSRIWRAVSDEDEAPEPTALDHNIREVLVAGALQGAVFGLVKAAMGRMTAKGYRRFTRNDPER